MKCHSSSTSRSLRACAKCTQATRMTEFGSSFRTSADRRRGAHGSSRVVTVSVVVLPPMGPGEAVARGAGLHRLPIHPNSDRQEQQRHWEDRQMPGPERAEKLRADDLANNGR